MKAIKLSVLLLSALVAGTWIASCDDACDYLDTDTDSASWFKDYENAPHPGSLAGTLWVRAEGLNYNAYGEEVQGYIESLDFTTSDSVVVTMSEGKIPSSMSSTAAWTDESNSAKTPYYEYTYSEVTGALSILKLTKDEKGKVSKTTIFTGVAVQGKKTVLTVCHYGDIPNYTYLVQQ